MTEPGQLVDQMLDLRPGCPPQPIPGEIPGQAGWPRRAEVMLQSETGDPAQQDARRDLMATQPLKLSIDEEATTARSRSPT